MFNDEIVAPEKEILRDYNKFKPVLDFEDDDIISSIISLSLLGHSKNGHSVYNGNIFPQTSINDILRAIELEYLREKSSNYIKNTYFLFKDILNIVVGSGKLEDHILYNCKKGGIELSDSKFVFSSRLFKDQVIKDPYFFLKGVYVASKMDSLEKRIETKEVFKTSLNNGKYVLGGGVCHIGDLKNIRRLKIDLKELENNKQSKSKLNYLINQKCIKLEDKLDFSKKGNFNLINIYIRGMNGLGICDDASILGSSMMIKKEFGFEKAKDYYIGMAMMDMIDTLDKVSLNLVTGGADEFIGNELNQIYKKKYGLDLATNNEIYRTIYIGSKTNTFKLLFSSSVRYFNQEKFKEDFTKYTAHRSHLDFLKNEKVIKGLFFGFQKVKSEDFYKSIQKRLSLFEYK